MPEVELSSGIIDYEDTGGNGPIVVLLHGVAMDGSLWRHVVGEFRDGDIQQELRLLAEDLAETIEGSPGGVRWGGQCTIAAEGTQSPYGRFWPRLAAAVIDWGLCFLVFYLTPIYFAYFWSRGQSLGMKAFGLRILDPRTGAPPTAPRALARWFFDAIFFSSLLIPASFFFGDPPEGGYSSRAYYVLSGLGIPFAISAFGYLWMIRDARKQTLQDRVTGVVVISGAATRSGQGLPP